MDSKASQYSARQPLPLPMAWEYSHRITGRVCSPLVAWLTSCSIEAYMGTVRSDAAAPAFQPWARTPSYCTGRVGSAWRTHAAAASWLGP